METVLRRAVPLTTELRADVAACADRHRSDIMEFIINAVEEQKMEPALLADSARKRLPEDQATLETIVTSIEKMLSIYGRHHNAK